MGPIDPGERDPLTLAEEYRRKADEVQAAYDQALFYARDLSQAYHAERTRTRQLAQAWEATVLAMVTLVDVRDSSTEQHSRRVAEYTRLIAMQMGNPDEELSVIHRGALLHDIGKIGVPDHILLKQGPLTPEEWVEMRKHPEIGWRALNPLPYLREASIIVLHHHEHWAGGGYPQGLKGEDIHIGARVFAVADALDAMTSDRPYRKALPWAAAVAEIARVRGTQFDPNVVDAFMTVVDELETVMVGSHRRDDRRSE